MEKITVTEIKQSNMGQFRQEHQLTVKNHIEENARVDVALKKLKMSKSPTREDLEVEEVKVVDDEETPIRCFLKTHSHHFKEFKIRLEESKIYFLRNNKQTKELNVYHSNDLKSVHVQIGSIEKCPDTQASYFSLVLVLPTKRTRAIYFNSK